MTDALTIRKWFRFSLRTVLTLFTCVAVAMGWFAYSAKLRSAAFAAVRQAGGDIRMSIGERSYLDKIFGADLFGNVTKIDLRKGKVDNELLRHVGVLNELKRLDLSNADINDAGLRHISHLPLRELWLQSTDITDASAATLSTMSNLRMLSLNANSLSDKFLEQLKPLPQLEDLGLRGTKVTGGGMKYISRHSKLKKLHLYHTEVDDSGVQRLVDCQSLTHIGLSMTKISNRVFEHLEKLPNLTNADLSANREVTTESVLAFEKSHATCDIEWYGK